MPNNNFFSAEANKRVRILLILLLPATLLPSCTTPNEPETRHTKTAGTIQATVLTTPATPGRQDLFAAMNRFADVAYTEQPLAVPADPDQAATSVIILADLTQYDPAALQAALNTSAGLVILQPALANAGAWPPLQLLAQANCDTPPSPSAAPGPLRVRTLQPDHPLVRGMSDFYLFNPIQPPCRPADSGPQILLAADDNDTPTPVLWIAAQPRRVACLQLGPDLAVYLENGMARWVLHQAIRWAAGQLPEN